MEGEWDGLTAGNRDDQGRAVEDSRPETKAGTALYKHLGAGQFASVCRTHENPKITVCVVVAVEAK